MSVTDEDEAEETPGLRPNGTPDPAYAAALGLKPAGVLRRSLAFLLDAALLAVASIPAVIGAVLAMHAVADAASGSGGAQAGMGGAFATALVPLIVFASGMLLVYIVEIVQLVLHGLRGVTFGKAICGIRSVRATTFAKPGFWRIVLRALVVSAAFVIVPVIGGLVFVLSPLWDDEHRGRGWHDYLGGNWLVDTRGGLDPFDTKGMRHARKRVAAPERVAAAPLPSLATGAAAGFTPTGRSNSGVVGAAVHTDAPVAAPGEWSPPAVGSAPAGRQAPTAPAPAAAPAPAVPAPAEPVAASAPTPDLPTPSAETLIPEELRAAAREAADRTAASAPERAPGVATFLFDDGIRMLIDGGGLLGRNPQPRDGEDVHHLIPVADDTMQLSKTHAEFGLDEGGVWVTDRGSVNGTTVVTPEGERIQAIPGDRYPVRWGSVVEIGGRAFRVVHAADGSPAPEGNE